MFLNLLISTCVKMENSTGDNMKLVHVRDGGTGRYQIGVADDLTKARILAAKMILDMAFNRDEDEVKLIKNAKYAVVEKFAKEEDFDIEITNVKLNKVSISVD